MPTDPQPEHGHDEEAHRKIAEAILKDPKHDHPGKMGQPTAADEYVEAVAPPWHDDANHPGPPGWHKEPDANEPSGFHWVEDQPDPQP